MYVYGRTEENEIDAFVIMLESFNYIVNIMYDEGTFLLITYDRTLSNTAMKYH